MLASPKQQDTGLKLEHTTKENISGAKNLKPYVLAGSERKILFQVETIAGPESVNHGGLPFQSFVVAIISIS